MDKAGTSSLVGLKGNLSLALMVLVKWEHVPSVVLLNQEVLVYGSVLTGSSCFGPREGMCCKALKPFSFCF